MTPSRIIQMTVEEPSWASINTEDNLPAPFKLSSLIYWMDHPLYSAKLKSVDIVYESLLVIYTMFKPGFYEASIILTNKILLFMTYFICI